MSRYHQQKKEDQKQNHQAPELNSLEAPSLQLKADPQPGQKHYHDHGDHGHEHGEGKDSSARIEGDHKLKKIVEGKQVLKKGDKGLRVLKLQQALLDMGYKLPKFGADRDFGKETEDAVRKFQADHGCGVDGKVGPETLGKMDDRFDTRSDYVKAANDFDPKDEMAGTRKLDWEDRKDALKAMEPQKSGAGVHAKFQKKKEGKTYSEELTKQLHSEVKSLHQELYLDKKDLRKDKKKNFHTDKTLEGAANAAKDVTDEMYGDLNKGKSFTMGDNLIDQWKDEEQRNLTLDDGEKKVKAEDKLDYLIDANCDNVNEFFNANPSGKEERKIIKPIVADLVDSDKKIQKVLDIEKGWEGAQMDGVQYLQMYKHPKAEANRKQMWEIFHTGIHEYLHTLAHDDYKAWADDFDSKGDGTREHVLSEGFCDFFTLNVRSNFNAAARGKTFQESVEGDYYDKDKAPHEPKPGVYPSHRDAERVVGIVGINNAQLAYFRGKTKLMGAK